MVAVMVLLTAGHAAWAQNRSRTLTGTVVDSANHKPISPAAIFLGRVPTGQRTGGDGTFRVPASTGSLVLMVRRPGYIPALISIRADTTATDMDLGTISLRQVRTDADRADAQATDLVVYPELAQFYDRKARYRAGLFLTPDDLQRVGGSLFNYIRQKPGFHFLCYVTQRGEWDCGAERSRGRTSIMNANPTSREQEPCLLNLWFNSVGVGPQRTLDQVQMSDVLAVEAYPNPGVTPPEFAGSPCAAIMLWMTQAGSAAARP